jgi:hypothetical protein
MSQQAQIDFSLIVSGMPVTVPNALQNSGSLTVTYVPQNATQSYSISVEGVTLASGEAVVLDELTAQTGTVTARSITLSSQNFDSFRFVATWSGAAQQFSIAVALTSTGSGPAWSSTLLPTLHTV